MQIMLSTEDKYVRGWLFSVRYWKSEIDLSAPPDII